VAAQLRLIIPELGLAGKDGTGRLEAAPGWPDASHKPCCCSFITAIAVADMPVKASKNPAVSLPKDHLFLRSITSEAAQDCMLHRLLAAVQSEARISMLDQREETSIPALIVDRRPTPFSLLCGQLPSCAPPTMPVAVSSRAPQSPVLRPGKALTRSLPIHYDSHGPWASQAFQPPFLAVLVAWQS
jgi:hypothetical protein